MIITAYTREVSQVTTRFEIDPEHFREETGKHAKSTSYAELYEYAIQHDPLPLVVADDHIEVISVDGIDYGD